MIALSTIITCHRPGGADYFRETYASLASQGLHPAIFDDVNHMGSRWNGWRALQAGGDYERLLFFEDDVVVSPGLVERMLTMEIPDDVGVVNLHDFGDDFGYESPPGGIYKFPSHRFASPGMKGSQCLLFPGEQAAWLAKQNMNASQPGRHCLDYAIGWWTAQSPRPNKLIVTPSPVRHIGERSACHDEERRAAGVGIPHAGRTLADLTVNR